MENKEEMWGFVKISGHDNFSCANQSEISTRVSSFAPRFRTPSMWQCWIRCLWKRRGVLFSYIYIYIKYFSKHSSRLRVFPCFQGQMYILVYLMKTRANDITWIMFCVSRNYQQNGVGENVGRYPVQQATTNVADVVSHKGHWWPAISDYSSICRIGISWPFNRVLEIYKMTHLIPL